MRTVERDGVALAYEERGRDVDDAPSVVLVEGLGYGRWMWRWLAADLAEDYHVVLPDNRGTGDSDAPEGPYTIAEMAADLDAVLGDAGVDAAHVVGASMGGMIAMRYALDFERVRSLVLLSTSHGGDDAVPVPDATRERMFSVPDDADEREAIRSKMRPAVSDGFSAREPDLVADIVDWRLESDAPAHARRAQGAAVEAFDVADELAGVDVPTLVLHGTDDRVLPVENGRLVADAIPGATFETVEGGPHLFFVEQREHVNGRIGRFLADHAAEVES